MEIKDLETLFDVTQERLENQHGNIMINFANRTHIYSGNDVIGNCLQEWLPNWFQYLGVDIRAGGGTQAFPDFIASFADKLYDVEVKAWNMENAPGFDLANFQSFLVTTYKTPSKLNARYFILGYMPDRDEFSEGFIVKKVFFKHIWEITGPSKKYPIGIQVKRGMPYALRPYNFYKRPNDNFGCKENLLKAIKETFDLFPHDNLPFTSDQWYEKVTQR